MQPHALTSEEVLAHVGSSPAGLTLHEAQDRLSEAGPNRLKLARKRSIIFDILEPFTSAFVFVLIIAAVMSLALGKMVDAIVVMLVVVANAGIFYVQSFTAHRALQALKKQDVRAVKVRRGGTIHALMAEEIVVGDVVQLYEGLKVPADGRVLASQAIQADESMLTGESLPVAKGSDPLAADLQMYAQANMVFSGTFVRSGIGEFVVTATGNDTELGRIAKLSRPGNQRSPLQRKIDSLTGRVVIFAIAASSLAFLLGLYRGIPAPEMLRFALSMTVSAVPEGLPVALTIVLIFGVRRMARRNALVRNLQAVETLGQATVIATDKTGTITKNELSIAYQWQPAGQVQQLEQAAVLSAAGDNHADDPLEQVLVAHMSMKPPKGWRRLHDIPFDQKLRMSGVSWKTPDGYGLYVKGAPEAILASIKATKSDKAVAAQELDRLTAEGLRLIGFASATSSKPIAFSSQAAPKNLTLEGIIAFSDELRPGIAKAVQATRDAGIDVIMVTGDHLQTARTFGLQAGIIKDVDAAVEGEVVRDMPLTGVRQLLRKTKVFARVLPEHKYKILEALDHREVTAMTGDGVNDVPAIVRADVGLAMGNGTDAAKEASDVVLLDNNYATIVAAIKEGRAIVANVRKMVFYLFATNLGEVLTMIGALAVGLPLPLTAVQVLWVNVVTDGFLVIPLGLEPAEGHHMKRRPERVSAPLLNRQALIRVGLTAVTMAICTLVVFALYLPQGLILAQTMAFAVLVAVQFANALNARSDHNYFGEGFTRPNLYLTAGLLGSFVLQLVVFMGPLREVFGLAELRLEHLWPVLVAVAVVLVTGDLYKRILRGRAT